MSYTTISDMLSEIFQLVDRIHSRTFRRSGIKIQLQHFLTFRIFLKHQEHFQHRFHIILKICQYGI